MSEPAPSTAKGATTPHELSRAQQSAARRAAESRATVPDFTLAEEVDMEACIAAVGEGPQRAALAVVRATGLALREHPELNASYRDGTLLAHERINIALAAPGGESPLAPTLFDADRRSLAELDGDFSTLAERVASGAITAPELGGATFAIAGPVAARALVGIIVPPQVAGLGLGSLEQRVLVRAGAAVVARAITLTLVCDQRAVTHGQAGACLARLRELLEEPAALLS